MKESYFILYIRRVIALIQIYAVNSLTIAICVIPFFLAMLAAQKWLDIPPQEFFGFFILHMAFATMGAMLSLAIHLYRIFIRKSFNLKFRYLSAFGILITGYFGSAIAALFIAVVTTRVENIDTRLVTFLVGAAVYPFALKILWNVLRRSGMISDEMIE